MNTVAKLTQKQIEKLAVEIRTFLLEHDMWVDTQIYFNGKCFDTHDKETGEFYYNNPEHLVVRENEDPRRYFENVAEDHILSMAFEGTVCHMLWYGTRELRQELQRRCGLSELQAINILNGFHVKDYIAIKEREYAENERRKAERDQDT